MSGSPVRPDPMSRRDFVQRTAVGVAAAAVGAPLIVPSRVFGASAPSNRIRVGCIGAGRIAQSHDMPGVAESGLADILAEGTEQATAVAERTLADVYERVGFVAPRTR